ncbi:MAG: helix-turn-helix transcriptional regulator [Rhodospirillales bacterium]|mgnify:FL=1|jgi:transcriptional regulator with XRE-family HTH domain|nr:helix-turn-helix transcriptional regulator [Rhodospirillales bacterium]
MLSEALRLIRVFHDLKQSELAAHLGLSKSYLSEIENGRKIPTLEVINKYAEEFNIPVSSIIFFSEQLNSNKPSDCQSPGVKKVIAGKIINFLQFVEQKTSDHGSKYT